MQIYQSIKAEILKDKQADELTHELKLTPYTLELAHSLQTWTSCWMDREEHANDQD